MGNMSDENCRDIAIRDYRTTTTAVRNRYDRFKHKCTIYLKFCGYQNGNSCMSTKYGYKCLPTVISRLCYHITG